MPAADAPAEAADRPAGPLPAEALRRRADLSALPFATTADLEPIEGLGVQPRVAEALEIGSGATARGFNIFAIGPSVARIKEALGGPLRTAAQGRPAPDDWVYVNNFATPHRPRALRLPAGRGPALRKALQTMVDDLRAGLPAMFESEDHQRRRSAIEATFHGRAEQAFSALGEKATERGVAILRTPMGFAVAPMRDGKVVQPEDFSKWTDAEREAARTVMSEVEKELEETLRSIPRLEKERREAVRALEKETARLVIDQEITEALAGFADLPEVVAHFDAVRADIVDNLHLFLAAAAAEAEEGAALPPDIRPHDRYEANLLVTRQPGSEGAPVIEELNPTLGNLVGRIEYLSRQGALVTNFRLIKPGALHRANGGVLLIDARSLLMEPFSWAALKRALLTQQIAIEDAHRFLGLATTVSLEPDPIPLDVKVVLFGDRMLYYLLAEYDPDMAKHFKVLADFDEVMDRSPESEALLARLVAGILQRDGAPALDRAATGCLLEHAARLAADSGRLSLLVEHLRDIAIEAGHRATAAGHAIVGAADVEATVRARRRRAGRIRDRLHAATLDAVLLVDTEGRRTGRVNGLSVMELGGEAFGRPSRITARARPGQGEIIDIEREVDLGGPIHSKGVLILSGYLAGHFAPDFPLSLHASLVFEQSYGGVEGDSASCAELCALLSEIAEIPLRQDLAITGSVNQQGDMQAIGGVNEKIEGFFGICAARGLTGTQGVIIPAANVRHLMLDAEVVQACAEGRFAVHAVRTVNEAMALLSGLEAGERGRGGAFPEGSVNRAVESRLRRFAELRRRWGAGEDGHRGGRPS